jgi:uncharacterized protein involved in exopolysaccharide biosynthesis
VVVDETVDRVRRHWRFCLLGVLLGGAVGYASTLLQTPIYQAEAVLAPVATRGAAGGLAQLLGPLQNIARQSLALGDDPNLSERAVIILRSRYFTEKFVESQGLVELLTPRSRLDIWLDRPTPSHEQRLYQGALQFRTSIAAVRVDSRTSFVTVSIRWSDPEKAAEWANALVAAGNEEARIRAIADADNAIQFLQDELRAQSAVPIQTAINQLIESQLNTKMLAKTRPQYVYGTISPAMPPPEGDYVSPDRPLVAAVAGMLGGVLALVVILRRRS